MKKIVKKSISKAVRLYLEELPLPISKYGDGKHPCFQPWRKMVDRCSNPEDLAFDAFGGRGITINHKWFDFSQFVKDMGASFEIAPEKPARLRRNYLARHNLRAGFNPENCYWTTLKEANNVQAKTILVDTVFGKRMTFRQIADYLVAHAGEPFPVAIDAVDADKLPAQITPIHWQELRRRHSAGLPLFIPVKREECVVSTSSKLIRSGALEYDAANQVSVVSIVKSTAIDLGNAAAKSSTYVNGIRIDSHIPPPAVGPRGRKYPFEQMKVGERLFVMGATTNAIKSAASYYSTYKGRGKRFRVMADSLETEDRTLYGAYVWRLE
jgi:hypothetical protein